MHYPPEHSSHNTLHCILNVISAFEIMFYFFLCTAHYLCFMHISVPPDITPFVFPAVEEGTRVQVACNVYRGDLPLNITWLKDQVPVATTQAAQVDVIRFNLYSSIVTMSMVSRADAGNYTCMASNPARTVSHTAQLSVSGNIPMLCFQCLQNYANCYFLI